ncbi:unnamed protein product [Owenia fusiformis]|uniref:Uncharacterized protein n=1 Tax=Owenia fusiformis TaxID=6347 RepID=A0A8J1TE02_OWEFU|nr:unnamed protein product [Owenia fusiformis]
MINFFFSCYILGFVCFHRVLTQTEQAPPWEDIVAMEKHHIDLMSAVDWKQPNVTKMYSPNTYKLNEMKRELKVNKQTRRKVLVNLKKYSDFTVLSTIKQRPGNVGAIVALSGKNNVYFEMQSNGRTNELRLYYRHDNQDIIETFPVALADDKWHTIAVTFSWKQLTIHIDCVKFAERVIKTLDGQFSGDKIRLWVGQRNETEQYFKGEIKEAKIVFGYYGYTEQCPKANTSCLSCGEMKMLESSLQQSVKQLLQHVHNLTQQLKNAESKVDSLEKQCNKGLPCVVPDHSQIGGVKTYKDGAVWNPVTNQKNASSWLRDPCVECKCEEGGVECYKVYPDECRKSCWHNGTEYIHGKIFKCSAESGEKDCKCDNGKEIRIEKPNQVTTTEGFDPCDHCPENSECINKNCLCLSGYFNSSHECKDVNECLLGKCHANATCTNLPGSYKCTCYAGFHGNGFNCTPTCSKKCDNGGICVLPGVCQCPPGYTGPDCNEDVDECSLKLHHCSKKSKCENLPGSYVCRCRHGYHSEKTHLTNHEIGDKCKAINQCKSGEHTCSGDRQCRNIRGRYKCRCKTNLCNPNCFNNQDGGLLHYNATCWKHPSESCKICQCKEGETSCSKMQCDCESSDVDLHCCPKCTPKDSKIKCRHHGKDYEHGHIWHHKCEKCECLAGEVSCTSIECPVLHCEYYKKHPNDCCPKCSHHDNNIEHLQATTDNKHCTLPKQKKVNHGSLVEVSYTDPCVNYFCLDGKVYATYNQTCSGEP